LLIRMDRNKSLVELAVYATRPSRDFGTGCCFRACKPDRRGQRYAASAVRDSLGRRVRAPSYFAVRSLSPVACTAASSIPLPGSRARNSKPLLSSLQPLRSYDPRASIRQSYRHHQRGVPMSTVQDNTFEHCETAFCRCGVCQLSLSLYWYCVDFGIQLLPVRHMRGATPSVSSSSYRHSSASADTCGVDAQILASTDMVYGTAYEGH
jgi:hypothetical protein